MTEYDNPGPGQMEQLIGLIAKGERPLDQRVAQSLREIYLSGLFRNAILRGSNDQAEDIEINALRIIMRDRGDLKAVSLVFNSDKADDRTLLDTMIADTNGLIPIPGGILLDQPAINALTHREIQTVAGLELSRSVGTGNEVAILHSPKAFGSLLPSLSSRSLTETFCDGMASYFLQSIPFGEGGFRINVPSH